MCTCTFRYFEIYTLFFSLPRVVGCWSLHGLYRTNHLLTFNNRGTFFISIIGSNGTSNTYIGKFDKFIC